MLEGMNLRGVKEGIKVKTNDKLGNSEGMPAKFIATRKANQTGVVKGFFMATGGDLWAVQHENGEKAVYCYTEFEEVSDGTEYDNMPHTD